MQGGSLEIFAKLCGKPSFKVIRSWFSSFWSKSKIIILQERSLKVHQEMSRERLNR
jgi:hypothetical protein